jgi:hypothetical protein
MCEHPLEKHKFELELFEAVLERYQEEYKEWSEIWRILESKAQATLTISGIFITASELFVKEVGIGFPPFMNLFVALVIICLAISVTCAVLVLITRQTDTAPTGSGYKKFANDLLNNLENKSSFTASDSYELKANLVRDRIKAWEYSISSREEACKSKAEKLKFSHFALLCSLSLVAFISIISIWWRQTNGIQYGG